MDTPEFPEGYKPEARGGRRVSRDRYEEARKRHEELATKVVLKVTADPNGTVHLDGKPVGKTPLEKLVPSSFSKVEVALDGYETWSTSLIPDGGTRVELSAELRRRGRHSSSNERRTQKTTTQKEKRNGISNESLMQMD